MFQFCGEDANDFFSPTSYVCLNYPLFQVAEMEWAPFGNGSGLCAGVAQAGVNNENVTPQTCGVTNKAMAPAQAAASAVYSRRLHERPRRRRWRSPWTPAPPIRPTG